MRTDQECKQKDKILRKNKKDTLEIKNTNILKNDSDGSIGRLKLAKNQ